MTRLAKNLIENQRRALKDTNVYQHAELLEFDPITHTCLVKPVVQQFNADQSEDRNELYEEAGEIAAVPISDIMGIRFIPDIGAHGILLFHDVDLEAYWFARQILAPKTARFHDYSDPIFIPSEIVDLSLRPDPYITIGCDTIYMHKNVIFEGDQNTLGSIGADGDVIAGTTQYSLTTLSQNHVTHTHTVAGTVTLVPNNPVTVGAPVIIQPTECPVVG